MHFDGRLVTNRCPPAGAARVRFMDDTGGGGLHARRLLEAITHIYEKGALASGWQVTLGRIGPLLLHSRAENL